MARVKVEEIVDYLGSDFRKALKNTINQQMPNNTIDEYALFREFKRAVSRKFGTWETVPDSYVEKQ